jgi:hypothetical protein
VENCCSLRSICETGERAFRAICEGPRRQERAEYGATCTVRILVESQIDLTATRIDELKKRVHEVFVADNLEM